MTATAKVSPPPSVTGWQTATVTNYTGAPARPVAVHVEVGGSITILDQFGVQMIITLQGIHYISPLNVTAASNAQVLFQ
jgi:hypothetical protein